jgi:hypothetical protein
MILHFLIVKGLFMACSTIENCSICLKPLGPVVQEKLDGEDLPAKFISVDLHKPSHGPVHRVHRICVFEWFQEQLDREAPGKRPDDTINLPFTCPICIQPINLAEAEQASGVPLKSVILVERLFKNALGAS